MKKIVKNTKTLKKELDINISLVTIERILAWIRRAFAHYIKNTYRCNKLGKRSGNNNISMDESLFTHENGQKIWIVECKNNYMGNIRVDIFKNRNTNDLKLFIENHIKIHNNIITDGWSSYQF